MRKDEPKRFGDFARSRRIQMGHTLRQFCLESGLDPAYVSRIERGVIPPPQDPEKLEHLAKLLGLQKDSAEWQMFMDLASIDAGRIPADVISDDEMVAKLPVLFRTVRGQKLTEAKLRELIQFLRGT